VIGFYNTARRSEWLGVIEILLVEMRGHRESAPQGGTWLIYGWGILPESILPVLGL
jgi:hypothetical protein